MGDTIDREKIIFECEEQLFGGCYALKRAIIESVCCGDFTEDLEFYTWLLFALELTDS